MSKKRWFAAAAAVLLPTLALFTLLFIAGASDSYPVLAAAETPAPHAANAIPTPVIDGVFTGELIDGDGTATDGIGTPHPTKFIEQKEFDLADNVYYQDTNGTGRADAGDAYWIDDGDGMYGGSDAVIVGTPIPGAGIPVNALAGETAIAYNDAEIDDNNRYDDGEDIYLVDSVGEFRGAAMQRIIYDPAYPPTLTRVLAHIYIANTTNTVFMHNDFIIDPASVWIDGDGTATPGPGTQAEIGFQPFTNTISATLDVRLFGRWFTTHDNVYWKSTGWLTDTWFPGDALWLDVNDDGVYDMGSDLVIIDTGGLSAGDIGRELNSDGPNPTYNFTYNDENGNGQWDDGEDIGTLDGDEIYDWNYFDDRWSWLVDGDGDATDGRGFEDLTRIDGNTWFRAEDQVYHWDADGNGDWNEGDGLWIDDDGDGLFSDGVDRVLVRGSMTGGEAGKLLQIELVDGDGYLSDGPGGENITRWGQTPFAPTDNLFWYDVYDDDNWFWSSGDGLWIDDDGDGLFTEGVDRVLVRGSMTGGEAGIRLSASAHHFGYDDGEVALNGKYDPGEDIYAANTYLAYDDMEIAFNGAYDPGEDIYDRDYIEIWVYAEGDSPQVPTDILHPESEPGLRDVGFRVHVNGIRVDDPSDDYDAPTGFQAAAGWGRSRGALAAWVPAGGYNRHYEYRLTAANAGAEMHLVSNGVPVNVNPRPPRIQTPRVWTTGHKIDWESCEMTWVTHWKDLRRGKDNYQGFGSSNGQREESVFAWWLHPPPPPPPPPIPPLVIKVPLFGPIVAETDPTGEYMHCWSIFVHNPDADPVGTVALTDTLPAGWWGGIEGVETFPPGLLVETGITPYGQPFVHFPEGLPPGGWAEIIVCGYGPIDPSTEVIINLVEGGVDDDGDPSTPPVPLPPAGSTTPVVREPEISLFKIPDSGEVEPGGRVTWRIGLVNTGQVAVNNVSLWDGGWTLPLDTLGVEQVHIVGLQTEVPLTTPPSTTLTNTVTMLGEFDTSLGNTYPYVASAAATVHVTGTTLPPPPYATLCTHEGAPITDFALRIMLDAFIPDHQSSLLVFTQCYGGDMLEKFKGRPGTGILSATSIGQKATYGGYDNDAAGALWPEEGRTSQDVHDAGVRGKASNEDPTQTGETVSLEPTDPTGDIQSRHVLVYAGCPDSGKGRDVDQRDTIVQNLSGQPNTTVTTVGGDGTGGWDYPGTLAGLRDALAAIGQNMNENEQFILFVTDHGDRHPAAQDVMIPAPGSTGLTITIPQSLIGDMLHDLENETGTGITLFLAGSDSFQGPLTITLATTATVYTDFVGFPLDLDGDGSVGGPGEGLYLFFPTPESALIPPTADQDFTLGITIENGSGVDLVAAYVSVDSGPIGKLAQFDIYLPLILREN